MLSVEIAVRSTVLFLCCLILSGAATLSADTRVRNYEECVKAGYLTGTAAGQERCWTPREFRIFVKGLKPTIRQGIYGTITLRTGNCMPFIRELGQDGNFVRPRSNPCHLAVVDREVYIFPLLGSRYKWGQPFLPTDMALSWVTRSKNGFYEIELPAGSYSVLVEHDGKKYCARANKNDEACPVTVELGVIWEHQILVNRAAS